MAALNPGTRPPGSVNTQRRLAFDQASKQRMAWAQHMLRDTLHLTVADVYQHAVVRRALDVYCCHLETILSRAPGKDLDIAHWAERGRLKVARNGADLCVPEDALVALPVRPLSVIVAEAVAARPKPVTPMQSLKADLARWERAKRSKDDDDDDE
ncbi:MAG: hypothetical protein ACYC9Z_16700 [Casimicrobiaceae bacterium]